MEQVLSLALLNFSSASVTAACVCFCELLGECSLKLRVDLKALNLILKLWSRNYEDGAEASFRQMLGEGQHLLFDMRTLLGFISQFLSVISSVCFFSL